MINYTKSYVKNCQIKSLIRINMLYGVCAFCISLFLFYMLAFRYQTNLPYGMTPFSYAAGITGALIFLISLVLPVFLYAYKKRITKIYRSEMKKPGEILYYSGGSE